MVDRRSFTTDLLLALPRLSGLRLAPDGRALVFVVQRLDVEGKKYVADLHRLELDETTAGATPQRLTLGDASDGNPRFLPDGSLLFLSARADVDPPKKPEGGDEPTAQVWHLPRSGEARPITRRALGLDALETGGGALVFASFVFPDARGDDDNRARSKARKEAATSMLEWDRMPIRFWDRFHGPRFRHLFVLGGASPIAGASTGASAAPFPRGGGSAGDGGSLGVATEEPRDLTPDARLDLDEQAFDVSADGRVAVASILSIDEDGKFHENLRVFDLATGAARALTDEKNSYTAPKLSPDGRTVACLFHRHEPNKQGRTVLALVDVATGAVRHAAESLDVWPMAPTWSADGARVYFTADERGEVPVFCFEPTSQRVRRVAVGGGYSDVCPSPDGRTLYALFSTWDTPPEVVALDANATDGAPRVLTKMCAPQLAEVALGAVERMTSAGPDGRQTESFLVKPPGAKPGERLPLLLWVHGGPVGAWSNHWHWRWNPHVFAARGWHVLMPNPRISLGYGQPFVEEGFARWGAEPYDDVIAAVDAACARPDVDPARTAAMGGSFGGYMVNWINGSTRRFRAIVTHASLYHLPAFHGTTDCGPEWEREFGNPYTEPEAYERWSPHRLLSQMKTPTLIVHGERDYRVPVSEAYMLFTGLQRHRVPSKLLYFPDENHWILKPPNSRAWHAAIVDWLERHLAPGA